MKGHIGILVKIKLPNMDGDVEEMRGDQDSLYVEDPKNQVVIMNTQVSISVELDVKKK